MDSSQEDVYNFAARPVIESLIHLNEYFPLKIFLYRCVTRLQWHGIRLWTNFLGENTYDARTKYWWFYAKR